MRFLNLSRRLLPLWGNKASEGVCPSGQYYAPFSGQKVKIKCFHNCFNSINDIKSNRLGVTQTCMQFHLLVIWHLTASFFPATPSVSERSRATRRKAPKGQHDSKEIFFNETRTERVVAGATCKDKCTQINRGSSTELQHSSRRAAAEKLQTDFSGHRTQPVSNGLL